jgi:hypothetical protein
MAFGAFHDGFVIRPVMRHIPVRVDLVSVFCGEGCGSGGKIVERSMTTEAKVFAYGWICGRVRL